MSAKEHIFEAEARGDAAGYARGRAEALAELRAASVPVYLWRRVDGAWEVCSEDDYGPATTADTRRRILYAHPPVAREAELAAKVERLREALVQADQFISNGIELGFIRMPDLDTPDSAHKTPGLIRAALAAAPEKRR